MAFGNLNKDSNIFGSSEGKTSFKDIKSSASNWLTDEGQENANSISHEEGTKLLNKPDEALDQRQDKPVNII